MYDLKFKELEVTFYFILNTGLTQSTVNVKLDNCTINGN